VSYLEVVDASREALQAERANTQLAGQRQIAAVQLIKALGGGWSEQQFSHAGNDSAALSSPVSRN
jgi:multidrug efflux system outer membrane protein